MRKKSNLFLALSCVALLASCEETILPEKEVTKDPIVAEDVASFKEVAMIDLGETTAAEISAYDPTTKKLFVVSNQGGAKVEIVDFSTYPNISKAKTISFPSNAGINSVAVNNGLLAIALDGTDKQKNGEVVILKTSNLEEVKKVTVGAMPDMVTFTPDGNYILTANEGEPNETYTIDPVGSISVLNVKDNYAVKTFDFSSFESSKAQLVASGFRIYGPKASFAQDIEPEYITVLPNSKTAYVTLQENNAVAEIDIVSGKINKIFPLGTLDHSIPANVVDFTSLNKKPDFKNWPVKSFYLPDAIANFSHAGTNYLVLANEGDTRDWSKETSEEVKVSKLTLDPVKFPNASTLKSSENIGDLIVSKYFGDTDSDGDYDELLSFSTRTFSIFNSNTGELVANVGRELAEKVADAGKYDAGRSPKKGVEVEGVTVGEVNGKTVAFIGMERADMVAVYDLSNPQAPKFEQVLAVGDAPEGLLFVKPKDSPNGRSLLIVASEEDGTIRCYQPNKL